VHVARRQADEMFSDMSGPVLHLEADDEGCNNRAGCADKSDPLLCRFCVAVVHLIRQFALIQVCSSSKAFSENDCSRHKLVHHPVCICSNMVQLLACLLAVKSLMCCPGCLFTPDDIAVITTSIAIKSLSQEMFQVYSTVTEG